MLKYKVGTYVSDVGARQHAQKNTLLCSGKNACRTKKPRNKVRGLRIVIILVSVPRNNQRVNVALSRVVCFR